MADLRRHASHDISSAFSTKIIFNPYPSLCPSSHAEAATLVPGDLHLPRVGCVNEFDNGRRGNYPTYHKNEGVQFCNKE